MAQLLDSSVDETWLSKDRREDRMRSGRERLFRQEGGSVRPKSRFSGHPWTLDVKLPLPAKEVLDAMESEVRGLLQEAPLGPIAKQWLEKVDVWVWDLVLVCRGTQRKVCGCWEDLIHHWELLLRVLPRKRRRRVLHLIRQGADLPWEKEKPASLRCPRTGGCPQNVNLAEAKDAVWRTLYEQLVEQAILPWDCRGRSDVDVLPLGMFPIFWTTKPGSEDARIIIDLRLLNEFLSGKYCKVELPSVQKGRYRHEKYD